MPYFDDLAERPLDASTIEGWLQTWSRLEELVTEAAALAMIAYTIDTVRSGEGSRPPPLLHRDPARRWRSGAWSWPGGWWSRAIARRSWRPRWPASAPRSRSSARRTSRIFSELEELSARYQRITGLHDGGVGRARSARCRSCSRSSRAPTGRSGSEPSARPRSPTSSSAATSPGCSTGCTSCASGRRGTPASPTSGTTSFPAKFRFDYTPADCERFHEAVERTVAPAVERMLRVRRQRLGLDALRPWDLAVDPYRDDAAPAVRDGRRVRRHGARGSSTGSTRRSAASSRP